MFLLSSLPVRIKGLLPVGLLSIAALSGAAQAQANPQVGVAPSPQTAPQLLPYTAKLIAGGGPVATFSVGQTCPSGAPNTATDTLGDGCLATDLKLSNPLYATSDTSGNIFFSDYGSASNSGVIRRVDAVTNVVTLVAGGASSTPSSGKSCGSGSTATSTDGLGDGCLGTQVQLGRPAAIAFDSNGNLFFSDPYNHNVREILATGGAVTTTGTIKLIDGQLGGTESTKTYGYAANGGSVSSCAAMGASCVVAATQGLLDGPYGIAFDSNNNLIIADQYVNAILGVNLNSTNQTLYAITIPPSTIGKLVGATSSGGAVCGSSGCNYGIFTAGSTANTSVLDAPWAVAVDAAGNMYFSNEYEDAVGVITSAGIINNFSGTEGHYSAQPNTVRGTAASFGTGASLGIASDPLGNVYIPDETAGLVWRVDGNTTPTSGGTPGTGQLEYVIAGGGTATTIGAPCSAGSSMTAVDTFGDGCPATQATFGANGGFGSATTFGLFGASLDQYADVFVGDPKNALVREISSGTQFGTVGANQPVDIIDIHFATGDNQITPVQTNGSTTYPSFQLTAGATNFSLGIPTCTTNNDNTPANAKNPLVGSTTDCLLPITATPSTLGPFTGTLQVTSALGAVNSFPLSGNYEQSPQTRTTLRYSAAATCSGTTTYSTTTPITLTATVIANGPNPPTGAADTVTFYSNGTQIGQPVQVMNTGSSSSPVYTATLTNTFSTTGTYTLTAIYSGDNYFHTSTGAAPSSITTSLPGYTITPISNQQNTVVAGQTGLFSFNVNQIVYSGTISFAVTGLPPNSSFSMSPQSITGTGCSQTSTVALSILTQQQQTVQQDSLAGGNGGWRLFAILNGLLLLVIGIRARKSMKHLRHLALVAALLLLAGSTMGCGKAVGTVLQPATPKGTYNITVTASSGSGSSATPIAFTLTVQ